MPDHPLPRSAATINANLAEMGVVSIDYTNWRGERGVRRVLPMAFKFGSNEWHREPQWLMLAHDLEKQADRWFAMAGVHEWKPG